ncbi:MAG: peptidylprolyl isomerase, partial [Clostridia bacterium]|nr:peptidylprolyl isomerase [Clostridia bacterium]
MKRLACVLMAFCLALPFVALAEADDPVAVRVGDFTYTQSQLQGSLDSMLELSEMLRGDAPTEAEKQARLQSVVDSFVGLGVIENKLTEAGKNDFTDAELESLNQSAQSKYEELWQTLYQQMQQQDADVSEAAVTSQLEVMGYTSQAILDELILQTRQNRAIEEFVGDIVLTQAQVDDYYEEQFVGPDRADYEGDIDRYDQEILMNNNEAFYTPAGYRYIRQIVLEIPEAALNATRTEQVALNRATQAMGTALQALTIAVTGADGWEDVADQKAAYDEANAALIAAQADYMDRLSAEALPLVQNTVDEITAAYAAGIDFKSLISRYSTDKTDRNVNGEGYPFHPDSKLWPQNFIDAASALEKPGDLSEPFVTDQGVHILCYAGDVPAGEHVLTDEERQLLNAAAERYYQLEKLNALIDEWQGDYEIEPHPALLKYGAGNAQGSQKPSPGGEASGSGEGGPQGRERSFPNAFPCGEGGLPQGGKTDEVLCAMPRAPLTTEAQNDTYKDLISLASGQPAPLKGEPRQAPSEPDLPPLPGEVARSA